MSAFMFKASKTPFSGRYRFCCIIIHCNRLFEQPLYEIEEYLLISAGIFRRNQLDAGCVFELLHAGVFGKLDILKSQLV